MEALIRVALAPRVPTSPARTGGADRAAAAPRAQITAAEVLAAGGILAAFLTAASGWNTEWRATLVSSAGVTMLLANAGALALGRLARRGDQA